MDAPVEIGARLASQGQRLKLLLAHLAGRSIQKRVEIDDLVQEVFVRALARPESLPGRPISAESEAGAESSSEPDLYRYLAHIARHVVVDTARALRSSKRGGQHCGALLELAITGSGAGDLRLSRIPLRATGPATRAQRLETSARMVTTFLALEPDHRRVLGLRQFEGLSARDTALRMGRGEVAIHSLYRRALAAWSERLGTDPRDSA